MKQVFAPFEPKRSLSSLMAVPSAMVLYCLYERNCTCKMALYWLSNHSKLLMSVEKTYKSSGTLVQAISGRNEYRLIIYSKIPTEKAG